MSSSTERIHHGPVGASLERRERRRKSVHVQPFRSIELLPRPRTPSSGLLPAAEVRPEPPVGAALRLRRAVALVVVLGTLCLAGSVASQRVAHDREPASSSARP